MGGGRWETREGLWVEDVGAGALEEEGVPVEEEAAAEEEEPEAVQARDPRQEPPVPHFHLPPLPPLPPLYLIIE